VASSNFVRQASTRLASGSSDLQQEQKKGGRARALSVKRIAKEAVANTSGAAAKKDPSAPIAVTTCAYLGTISVAKQRGTDVVVDALARLAARPDFESRGVAVVTSLAGIKIVETMTSDTLADVYGKDVTFVKVLTEDAQLKPLQAKFADWWRRPVFAIVHKVSRLGLISVELIQCLTGENVKEIEDAIKKGQHSIKMARNQSIKMKGAKANPFAPTSEPSVVPPQYRKCQISRGRLAAQRVLGNGQFGQVWLAHLKPRPNTDDRVAHIAVKMMKDGSTHADGDAFLLELEVMLQLRHPNLLSLVGSSLKVVIVASRLISPPWRSIRFRLALRTYAPWGARVVSQAKSRKIPTRNILPLFSVSRSSRGSPPSSL